jgi:hypothetical protein
MRHGPSTNICTTPAIRRAPLLKISDSMEIEGCEDYEEYSDADASSNR